MRWILPPLSLPHPQFQILIDKPAFLAGQSKSEVGQALPATIPRGLPGHQRTGLPNGRLTGLSCNESATRGGAENSAFERFSICIHHQFAGTHVPAG